MDTPTPLALPGHVRQARFADGPALAEALAGEIARLLDAGLAARGGAALAVSGGRSPVAFFRALARRALDWERVVVTLADERWVPPTHADSNARLVCAELLRGPAAGARFVPLYGGEAGPEEGVGACAARLAQVPRPFDAVLLGMGEDGHFASIFPGVPGLADLLSGTGPRVAAVRPPAAPHARMSLTVAALLDARQVFLQIQGARKRAVIEAAAAGGGRERLPVAALLQQTRVPFAVFFSPAE